MMKNQELELAWQLVQNTGCNVFLTGRAGTGKTTFLRELCAQTHKRTIVLAPTGIAAINAHGSTLHSFFQLPFGPYIPGSDLRSTERNYKFSERKRRIIRSLDLVVIDEISMVRADLLDCVDAVLRRYRDHTRPFGGVQLLLIGDLQQLAPVAKPEEWQLLQPYYDTQYFFSSHALKEAGYVAVELKTIYRQRDQHFIDLLNKIRNNEADEVVLNELNARYNPDFLPSSDEGYIRLTTHNWQADQINQRELDALDTHQQTYDAEIWKEYPELSFPTAEHLVLKVGAQVMFVKNDSSPAKQYFNGMIGTVVDMGENFVKVLPQDSDKVLTVMPEQWENTRYNINEETKEIEEELIGTFTQMPLKTAWAITVHKSQGLTFERAIIDVQYSFSHGQTYVALSRCRSLEGLVLSAPIPRHAVISDAQVLSYTRGIAEQIPDDERVHNMKRDYFLSLLVELFGFRPLKTALDAYIRHIDEWLSRQQPEGVARWKEVREEFVDKVEKVSMNFYLQYQGMVTNPVHAADYATDVLLQERCKKGAAWFDGEIMKIQVALEKQKLTSRNKMVAERMDTLFKELQEQVRQKRLLLKYVAEHGFSVVTYLHERNIASLVESEKKKTSRTGTKRKKSVTKMKQADVYADIVREVEAEMGGSAKEVCAVFDEMNGSLPY